MYWCVTQLNFLRFLFWNLPKIKYRIHVVYILQNHDLLVTEKSISNKWKISVAKTISLHRNCLIWYRHVNPIFHGNVRNPCYFDIYLINVVCWDIFLNGVNALNAMFVMNINALKEIVLIIMHINTLKEIVLIIMNINALKKIVLIIMNINALKEIVLIIMNINALKAIVLIIMHINFWTHQVTWYKVTC